MEILGKHKIPIFNYLAEELKKELQDFRSAKGNGFEVSQGGDRISS